ncbi:GIY-YIG nuclease family protein [Candidatus Saccharibacteria bacterium]|nr:GIY-YIG nuclease family protein [Candidatus Saccharibacteria bacterium]MBR3377877.1 GIY-YIG nuclease family protein [Candidatus Saccharibacteria bacterium]
MTPKLKEKLKQLPKEPGVYFHKDKKGEVIYVGKAAILKNRVRQYFQSPDRKDAKTRALVAEIDDTDWIVVDTEMDALFLESEMIKRYKPKWNILLRDDKSVTYVRIDMKSEIPCVTMTRNPEDDGAEYFGPYYGKTAIMRALRILRKIFPYYDRPYTGRKTLNTDLGLTPGIEVEKCTPREYKRNLRRLTSYLKGNRKRLVRDVEKLMYEAAEKGEYERAAEYRNQFFGLKGLGTKIIFSDKEFLDISSDQALGELQQFLKLKKPPVRIEGYDISHQSGTNVTGSMVCFINGTADRTKYRRFKLRKQQNNDPESMREVLTRRLRHLEDWGKPDLIVLDGSVGQLSAVREICTEAGVVVIGRDKSGDHSKNARIRIVIPEGSDDYRMVELAPDSHIAKLIARIDDESHRFAIQYHTLLKRKDALK